MIQFIYYVLIIICLGMLGWLFTPRCNQGSNIFGIPLIGAGVCVIACFYGSYFGVSFTNISKGFLVLIFIILILILGKSIRQPSYIKSIFKESEKEDLIAYALCGGLSSIPICLYAFWGAQFPYCDGYTYISIADYLLNHGYRDTINPETMAGFPWLSQMYIYQANHFRIGSQMILSLFTGVFHRHYSIELFLPCISVGIFLYGMATLSMIKSSFSLNKSVKIITVIVCCLNTPIVIWLALYGFMPQIWGNAFFMMAIASFIRIEQWKTDFSTFFTLCEASIGVATLCFVYNEMLPFLVISILFLLAYKLIIIKDKRKEMLLNTIICAAMSLLLVSLYLTGMLSAVLSQMGATVGWDISYNFVTYLGYVFSIIPPEYNISLKSTVNILAFLVIFIMSIVVLVTTIRIIRNEKANSGFIKFFAVLSIIYVLMFFYFRFIAENPWGTEQKGNSWSIFKLVQYYAIVILPFLGILLSVCYEKNKRLGQIVVFFFILINTGYSFWYMDRLAQDMKIYTGNTNYPLSEYYQLAEKYKDVVEPIDLQNLPIKHRQMVTYFLRDHELISDWSSDGYFSSIPNKVEEKQGNSLLLYYIPDDRNTIANIRSFREEDGVFLDFKNGFYEEENYKNCTLRWSNREATMVLGNCKNKKVRITLECNTAVEENGYLSIETRDGKKIANIDLGTEKRTINFEVSSAEKTLDLIFKFAGETTIPDETDGRSRAFVIQNWTVKVIED